MKIKAQFREKECVNFWLEINKSELKNLENLSEHQIENLALTKEQVMQMSDTAQIKYLQRAIKISQIFTAKRLRGI